MSWMTGRMRSVLLLLGLFVAATGGCRPSVNSEADNEPVHVLTGKPAPPFATSYLNGDQFDLAQHLGKDVVILDFWATWCGPCRAAMPTLSEVASEFGDRGVKLFAVNCGEQPEAVKDFIEQSGLELTVIMDPDGEISKEYGVEGIPQTVLIDRQGTVRFVHVGLKPDLREVLTRQLTELAAAAPAATEQAAAAH